jgi:photosystem II stability/assembly factor-like uncharacterized protein
MNSRWFNSSQLGVPAASRSGTAAQRARRVKRRLALETLEQRTQLSGGIPLNSFSWTPIGPAPIVNSLPISGSIAGNPPLTGRITGIATDPTDPNTIYLAAAGGGVWKTTDGGQMWTPLTDDITAAGVPAGVVDFMGAIAVAPSNPQVIYAGTGEASNSLDSYYGEGLLKSTDGGNTWTLLGNQFFNRRAISKIVVDPNDPNTVYVAVAAYATNGLAGDTGVWKSTDGGNTWTDTTAGISSTDPYEDLVIDPADPNTLFTTIGVFGEPTSGIYKTTDGGNTWKLAGNAPSGSTVGRTALAIAPSNPNTIYAAIADPNTFGLSKMLVSTDGGNTWNATGSMPPNYLGGQGWYDTTLIVDPTDSQVVFAGGSFGSYDPNLGFIEQVEETTNGGNSWTDITVDANGNGVHPDHHAMAFDAAGNLIDGNDGGIWRLNNTLTSPTWQSLNTNLQITQFTGIALDPGNPNLVLGGSQDNGTEKFTGSAQWTLVQIGDGGFVQIDPTNPNTMYHTFYRAPGSTSFIERSDDGGVTWTDISNGISSGDNSAFYPPYVMDPENPDRLVLGTDNIYETTNQGGSWKLIATVGSNGWNPGAGNVVTSLAIAPTNSNTIYATTGSGFPGVGTADVWVTFNDGGTWTKIDIPGAGDSFGQVQVDPNNNMIAYVVRDSFNNGVNTGHVFKTTNGGQTWTDITGNLPDMPTDSIAIDDRQGFEALYVGTDAGVYASTNGGQTWSKFRAGLPNAQVRQLVLDTQDNILAAATHGRGAWEIAITSKIGVEVTPPSATEGSALVDAPIAIFSDAGGPYPLSDYTITIDWGDGTPPSSGTVVPNPDGTYSVLGSHTYAEEGPYTISVTVANSAENTSGKGAGNITVADAPLTANSGTTVNLTQSATPVTVALGGFTDGNPNPPMTDFSGTINWGDNSAPTAASFTARGNGAFSIQGSHAYTIGGTYTVTATVNDVGGSTVQVTTTVVVADVPLQNFTGATLNSEFEGPSPLLTLATFDDPFDPRPDHTAMINWGDSTTSPGAIATNPSGGYMVTGTHPFEEGNYTITITITDALGNTVSVPAMLTVNDAPLTPKPLTFRTTVGQPYPKTLGTFVDGNPLAPVGDFTVTINWGDHTTSPGTLVARGNGVFSIFGPNKTYRTVGSYPVSIAITDTGGSTTTVNSTALVQDAPILAFGTTVSADEGAPFAAVVSKFTSLNPYLTQGDFSAVVLWGDGQSSAGQIVPDPSGGYDVVGSHIYQQGNYNIIVQINDTEGTGTASVTPATVADAPLSSAGTIASFTAMTPSAMLPLATFRDANPFSTVSQFTAVVTWGDGTASPGTIVPNPDGTYTVLGSHTYALSTDYPIQVSISDVGGASTVAASAAVVGVLVVPVSVSLNPMSDSSSPHIGVTHFTQPIFDGTAAPFATVQLFAQQPGQPSPSLIGQATAGADGTWSLTSAPLGAGQYSITATSVDQLGHPNSPTVTYTAPNATGDLIIQTSGPHVASSTFNPSTGQAVITYVEDVGPLNVNTLLNPALYTLASNSGSNQVFPVTGVSATPNGLNSETVVVDFAVGQSGRFRGRGVNSYVLTIQANGATDAAGNPLIETYYTAFPQLGNQAGNYIAEYNTSRGPARAQQYIPVAAQRAAFGYGRFLRRAVHFRR